MIIVFSSSMLRWYTPKAKPLIGKRCLQQTSTTSQSPRRLGRGTSDLEIPADGLGSLEEMFQSSVHIHLAVQKRLKLSSDEGLRTVNKTERTLMLILSLDTDILSQMK